MTAALWKNLARAITIALASTLASAAAPHARAQSQIARISGDNNTVVQVIIELSQGDPDWLRNNEARITKLSGRLGVTNALIVNFLGKIDHGDVSREKWPQILAKVAEDYGTFRQRAQLLAASDPIAKDLVGLALEAAARAEFAEADRLLIEADGQEAEAEEELDAAKLKRRKNRVEFRVARARNFLVELKHAEAAALFEEAAGLAVSVDHATQIEMLKLAALTYERHGEDQGDNGSLGKAIAIYRDELLPLNPRDAKALDWAKTQNNLGNALTTLGEHESSSARLDEAVAAFRAALGGMTRQREPLYWAGVQNGLGNALVALGDLESGTARLDEAIAAYRAALEELSRERAPIEWAKTQINLTTALTTLGERQSGTAGLDEAVAAIRAMLQDPTRERLPQYWAMAQVNLGSALITLGEREAGTARFEEAVSVYRAALMESTREREPYYWAWAQFGLGSALKSLGEREGGTARLEDAIAAYRHAQEELTRERLPLDWAASQNNLGFALALLGERKQFVPMIHEGKAAVQSAWEVYKAVGQSQYDDVFIEKLAGFDKAIAKLDK